MNILKRSLLSISSLLLVCTLFSSYTKGEKKQYIRFIDNELDIYVSDVQVYNDKKELIGSSNSKGYLFLNNLPTGTKLQIKHKDYLSRKIEFKGLNIKIELNLKPSKLKEIKEQDKIYYSSLASESKPSTSEPITTKDTLVPSNIEDTIVSENVLSENFPSENIVTVSSSSDTNSIYTFVDEIAEFPGGRDAMMKFLSKNVQYPQFAIEEEISGKVFLRFIVDLDGRVSNIVIVRGVTRCLDIEAYRVISEMPNWTPGKSDGKAVRSYFTIPINFTLK